MMTRRPLPHDVVESKSGSIEDMNRPATLSPDPFAAFEAALRKIVAVPKKALDRKVKAFKDRKKKRRR